MTDRKVHRLTLLMALFGVLTMLAAAIGRMDFWIDYQLPGYETSQPALPDWPEARKTRHAA